MVIPVYGHIGAVYAMLQMVLLKDAMLCASTVNGAHHFKVAYLLVETQ